MKKILTLLVALVFAVSSAHAIFDKYTVNREDLPLQAQEMLTEHFPKGRVGMIKVDKHLLKKTDYDVRLVDGTTIEFSNAGKWTSVDCGSREVPSALVPRVIRNYVEKNCGGAKVVCIEKKGVNHQIRLSDGITLKFNALGKLTGTSIDEAQ